MSAGSGIDASVPTAGRRNRDLVRAGQHSSPARAQGRLPSPNPSLGNVSRIRVRSDLVGEWSIDALGAMPNLEALAIRCARDHIDLRPLTANDRLDRVDVWAARAVVGIRELLSMPGLRWLHLENVAEIDDLSALLDADERIDVQVSGRTPWAADIPEGARRRFMPLA